MAGGKLQVADRGAQRCQLFRKVGIFRGGVFWLALRSGVSHALHQLIASIAIVYWRRIAVYISITFSDVSLAEVPVPDSRISRGKLSSGR